MAHEAQEEVEITLDRSSLDELAARVRAVLDIQDRRYGFPPRTYANCFVGHEAVQRLIDEQIASDEADAVRLGNLLLNAGVFHHVQHAHSFAKAYLFYRFASDEDHGTAARKPDGKAVSWADFMARMVIRNALFFGRDKFSNFLIPWATYTEPEIAHVGLYERDLQARDMAYKTFTRHFADVDRAVVDGETKGFVKIHVKKSSDDILGATIVSHHAGDMISELTVAMQSGMGLGKLASVIHPYPTAAEAIRQCGDAYNRSRLTPTVRGIFDRLMSLRR